MRIELRILSGARAGQSEVFEQQTILVGRKLSNDLRFDAHDDLDVSAKHAEIRERSGRWYVVDLESTNGTFVNGLPVKGETPLKDGDVIAFGKNGPTVEVRAKGEVTTGSTPAIPRTTSTRTVRAPEHRMSTQERVAIAVREQTRGIKTTLIGSMIGLGALAIVAYWIGTREGSKQVAQMQEILAQAEAASAALRDKARGDTSFTNAMVRQIDSLKAKVQAAMSRGNEAQIAATTKELEQTRVKQQGLATMDFSAIHDKNDNAIAFLVTELDGQLLGGTAFGVTKNGLLVTNRHNVRSETTGSPSTRLEVQYANTSVRLPARVVKVSDGDGEDLALIQIERPGEYPTVAGVSGSGAVKVGSPLVTIGFPFSLELQMQGNTVQTTLSGAHASKHIPSLLQLDSFGAHGLSGAPVFDARGYVVGVVYGGPRDDVRIVYAVPSDRLVAFMGELGKSIVP